MLKIKSYTNLFLFTFLIITTHQITSQWSQVYQSNSNYYGYFGGLYFIDQNTGFVACQDSSLMKTTNGGLNWFTLNGTGNHG